MQKDCWRGFIWMVTPQNFVHRLKKLELHYFNVFKIDSGRERINQCPTHPFTSFWWLNIDRNDNIFNFLRVMAILLRETQLGSVEQMDTYSCKHWIWYVNINFVDFCHLIARWVSIERLHKRRNTFTEPFICSYKIVVSFRPFSSLTHASFQSWGNQKSNIYFRNHFASRKNTAFVAIMDHYYIVKEFLQRL